MIKPKKAEVEGSPWAQKFGSAISRFSASLSDLREFSELVESLIKKHKLKELEVALARYEGLGELLCQVDPKLKSDISLIQKAYTEELVPTDVSLEVGDDSKVTKIFRGPKNREEVKEFKKSITTIFKTENSVRHLQQSSLISLISLVESFLSQLLHIYFEKYPAALNQKEKQFTFEELSNFSSLDDARAYLISWKIENLLRGSYEDWIEYLKNHVKLELSVTTKHLEYLKENFQRRNLFVHNGGMVNKIYLSKVATSKPEMLNKKLGVSKDYLFSAIDRFESSFLQLGYELWGKCDKDSENRPGFINDSIIYEALQNKRWRVAAELAEIVERDKAASEGAILTAKVNSWIARKEFEDKAKVIEEINNFDVSAKDDIFKLAKHCLLNETEAALSLLKRLEKSKQLSLSYIIEWPLFKDIREIPQMESWLEQKSHAKRKAKATSAEKDEPNIETDSDSTVEKPKKTSKPHAKM